MRCATAERPTTTTNVNPMQLIGGDVKLLVLRVVFAQPKSLACSAINHVRWSTWCGIRDRVEQRPGRGINVSKGIHPAWLDRIMCDES
jgi:hypothetical protein